MTKAKTRRRKAKRITVRRILERLEIAAAVVPLTCEQWSEIAAILFPRHFCGPAETPTPTLAMPGSPAKVDAMADRAVDGKQLWSPRDADPVRQDRLAAKVKRDRNGAITWVD